MAESDGLVSRAEAVEDTLAMREVPRVAAEPAYLGRYLVGERLGTGAYGVVYRAYDPELRRDVALKLLGAPAYGVRGSARSRLLREARSLSRVLHPNVVPIYDVGSAFVDGVERVYLVMELVAGASLAGWLNESQAWRDVARVFLDAGRGLAATHAAGLVHRDFKPSNVLVTDDGTAKVVDFGLAALYTDGSASEQGVEGYQEDVVRTDPRLVGTPLYMAPEQLAGESVDRRSDQYSFCLSLAEAIDVAPEPAEGGAEELLRQRRRPLLLSEPPAGVPAAVIDLLRKGLSPDPSQRFDTMEVLLGELQRACTGSRRRNWGAYVVGVGLFAVVSALAWPRSEQTCGGDPLARVWNEAQRAETREKLSASIDVKAGEATIGTVDDYATRLREQWAAACKAQSDGAAMRCLERQRHALQTVIPMLTRADVGAAQRGRRAAIALPSLTECDEQVDTPKTLAASASRVELSLEEVRMFRAAGEFETAMHTLEAIEDEDAAQPGTAWAREVAVVRAMLLDELGRYDEAVPLAEGTYYEAIAVGDRRRAHQAALELTIGYGQTGDREAAQRWLANAAAQGDGTPSLLSVREQHLAGVLLLWQGQYLEALPRFAQAREVLDEVGGDEGLLQTIMDTEAAALDGAGRPHEALAVEEEVQAMIVARLGATHPDRITSLVNIGNARRRLWDLEAAREAYAEAVEIATAAEVRPVELAGAELGLAGAEAALGVGDPLQRIAAAKERLRETLPPEHWMFAGATVLEAEAFRERGEYDEAVARAHAGLAAFEASLGAGHHFVGVTHCVLGTTELARARHAAAVESLSRCVDIFDAELPADHVELGDALADLGRAELLAGDLAAAREHLRRGVAIAEARQVHSSRLTPMRADLERAVGRDSVSAQTPSR